MQKHHWIESDDMEARPWAIDVTHTYSRRKPTNQDLGFVVHVGRLGGSEHLCLTVDDSFADAADCATAIANAVEDALPLTPTEINRIEARLNEIINE